MPEGGTAERRALRPGHDSAIETTGSAGVATAAVARDAHPEPDRVLITVDAQFLDLLDLPAGRALMPELLAGPAPVPGLAGLDRLVQRLRIHPRQHQHHSTRDICRDSGNEPVLIEPWQQGRA